MGVHRVMQEGLAAGRRPRELSWEETVWGMETSMLLRRGDLSCGEVFTAQAEEDNALVSDFILKGVVKQ